MANISFINGAYDIQIAVLDDAGYAMGQLVTPNAPANGTTYPAYRLTHLVEVTAVSPSRELATDRGGQRIRGQSDLGMSDLGTFTMTLSDYDATFEAIIAGMSVNTTTLPGVTQSGPNFSLAKLPRLCMIASFGANSRDVSNYDARLYQTVIFPSIQIAPVGAQSSQNGGVNPNARQYTITPSLTTTAMNGMAWNEAAPAGFGMDYANDEAMIHYLNGTYRYMLTTFIGNGTEDEVTLPYRPVSSTATALSPNIITLAGSAVAPTSINTTTGVVVLSAAPTAGAKVVALVPTNFTAI